MNYSTAIFLISDTIRAVRGVYEKHDTPEKEMANAKLFKTFDTGLSVGDYVIVPTDTRHHMTVVKIVEIDFDIDLETDEDVKFIIGVVNRTDFEDLKRQESQAIERIKAAEKRRKREQLRKDLLADAADDPELKQLPIYTIENGDTGSKSS